MLERETLAKALRTGSPSDEDVVARVLAGETRLFELLLRRHNQKLFRAVRSVLKDDADAEDCLQQAWLAAWTHLGEFGGRAQLSTWLVRIALNEALMRARRQTRLTLVADVPDATPADEPSRDDDENPEHQVGARELRAWLERAVDRLPERYRTTFVLREVEELSTAEAAEVLGESEDVVKTRLHRARRLLREALVEQMEGAASDVFRFDGARCDRVVEGVLRTLAERGQL